jgi:osmotically-inducible protein OsmY
MSGSSNFDGSIGERPDHEIFGEIVRVLHKDYRLNPNGIQLRVNGGVVYLSGVVASESERNLIEGHANATKGVGRVDNFLQIFDTA